MSCQSWKKLSEAFKDKLELISLTENKKWFSKFQTKETKLEVGLDLDWLLQQIQREKRQPEIEILKNHKILSENLQITLANGDT